MASVAAHMVSQYIPRSCNVLQVSVPHAGHRMQV